MDIQLVDKIVHEVKSQGVFDEFRKDSISDVDTKPAYQNLRQRVENTVKKFLAEQKWTLDTNKNQLREKLRRHITESGFLDVGVERIVDQVVNPKIGSVFQPRIEEIAYKYLGLPPPPKKYEQPPPPLMHPLPPLPLNAPPLKVDTSSLLPTYLEQVSPDSDATVKSEVSVNRTAVDMDTEEMLREDEDESPPFEPLVKQEIEEIKDNIKVEKHKEINIKKEDDKYQMDKANNFVESNDDTIKTAIVNTNVDSVEINHFGSGSAELDKEVSQLVDARISQDSQLSSVSSDFCLSKNIKEDSLESNSEEAVAANISEEAQMPKFNENSCEPNATNGAAGQCGSLKSELHFDIKKDEIKFEGTERKTGLDTIQLTVAKTDDEKYLAVPDVHAVEDKSNSFKFSTNKPTMEVKAGECERTPNAQELSFGSSIEDSSSMPPNQTPRISIQNKEKDESPQIQTSKQSTRSTTPVTTPILTPPLVTPTATPSPVASLKPTKDHHNRYSSSSSSSKHKKRSKERRRSSGREKEKYSREQHRSGKEIKDSSKYHASGGTKSSSKNFSSSSSSKSSSANNRSIDKDLERPSSYSAHSSLKHTKHSHSSSSPNENQEHKKSKRVSDRRHHHSSSSSKRNERTDDHAEAKHKIQKRKSTDSNDDDRDKSMSSASKYSSQYKSSYVSSGSKSSKSSGGGNSKSSTSQINESQKGQIALKEISSVSTIQSQHHNNVVILNDILENPQTQFIQLNNRGHLVEMPIQQQCPSIEIEQNKSASDGFNNISQVLLCKEEFNIKEKKDCRPVLLYFDEMELNLINKMKLLNDTIDLCRNAVNNLRFDACCDESIELSYEEDFHDDNNKINLLKETFKRKSHYNYEEFETTPRKRCTSIETEGRQLKTSPTPSDTSSVNSKENEEIHKNTYNGKQLLLDRHKAVPKLSQQQRYSSEDLYKPRPILGQRSRRRGMEPLV